MVVLVSWLRWFFGIVLTIIGFGGFPDAIRGWMGWLAMAPVQQLVSVAWLASSGIAQAPDSGAIWDR